MTLFLLEENVLRELRSNGDATVRAWIKTVPDSDLRLSAMTLFEKRLGWQAKLRNPKTKAAAEAGLAQIAAMEKLYENRIVPIDAEIVAEWARLLGAKQKNQRDMAIAATARVHGMVIVTRNVRDFEGRGVLIVNPFKSLATIVSV